MSKAKWQNIAGSKKKFNSGDEEQNDADEEGIVIDDYDDFEEEEEDTEKGHNRKKSPTVLSKGQLISYCPYELIVFPKMPTKLFPGFLP